MVRSTIAAAIAQQLLQQYCCVAAILLLAMLRSNIAPSIEVGAKPLLQCEGEGEKMGRSPIFGSIIAESMRRSRIDDAIIALIIKQGGEAPLFND